MDESLPRRDILKKKKRSDGLDGDSMWKKSNEKQFEEKRWNSIAKKMREQRRLQITSHSEETMQNSLEEDMDWNFLDESSGSDEEIEYNDKATKEVISLDSASASGSSSSEGEVHICKATDLTFC
jgi:hypothetical protein